MAYTQAQLDALEAAYAEGVTRVKYENREIEYRSLRDMERVIYVMRKALGLARQKRSIYPKVSKGL